MTEEIEAPTEQVQEEIHHAAHQAREKWIMGVALSSAILAAFAAVAALMASHHSNEAMINQIQASDIWSFYQAKSIKASVVQSRVAILEAMGKTPSLDDQSKIAAYKKDQDEQKEKAEEKEKESRVHLEHHVVLARSVTLFQVAIAVAAVSVLTKRRRFWFVSLCFGALGLMSMIMGLLVSH